MKMSWNGFMDFLAWWVLPELTVLFLIMIWTGYSSQSKTQSVQVAQANPQAVDLTQPTNRPYLPVRMESDPWGDKFEVAMDGVDITSETLMRWVFVIRKKDHMIFRALIGDPDAFGPIVRGRTVRLARVHFWQNPSYQTSILVVASIE